MEVEQMNFVTHLIITVQLYYYLKTVCKNVVKQHKRQRNVQKRRDARAKLLLLLLLIKPFDF